MAADGTAVASSEELARAAGVTSAKVRKDLSHLGSYGTRGVGYDVAYLIHQIRRELGLTQDWDRDRRVGNLGHALANYKGFADRGFRVAALVDVDPTKVGEHVGDLEVVHITPSPSSSRSAYRDRGHRDAGDRRPGRRRPDGRRRDPFDLNFAPVPLAAPAGVSVRSVDLAVELQILAYYEQRKAALADVRHGGGAVAFAPTR